MQPDATRIPQVWKRMGFIQSYFWISQKKSERRIFTLKKVKQCGLWPEQADTTMFVWISNRFTAKDNFSVALFFGGRSG